MSGIFSSLDRPKPPTVPTRRDPAIEAAGSRARKRRKGARDRQSLIINELGASAVAEATVGGSSLLSGNIRNSQSKIV